MQAEQKRLEIEYLRPDEILAAREAGAPVFLPIGPLEWHGPHLPLGVDPLRARWAAESLARRLDGLLMPTLFIGTERARSPEMLRNIGFEGTERIEGMDFPACPLKSLYFDEPVFEQVLRNQLELLLGRWGFRTAVIVNGHGAENQLEVLERLCAEFNARPGVRVLYVMPMLGFPDNGWGHATLEETETFVAYAPDSVELGVLPPAGEPLENTKWAIVDDASFRGNSGTGIVCEEEDPRRAEAERGRSDFERTVEELATLISRRLEQGGSE